MLDEQSFIRRLESADAREFAQILFNPTSEEERVLRIHLGDAVYERQHSLAQEAAQASRSGLTSLNLGAATKGKVIVIHGIMGAELGWFGKPDAGVSDLIWVNVRRIFGGWVERLRLEADGSSSRHDVRAVGIIKSHYGDLLLRLLTEQWDAHAFWFDWRKDLTIAADALRDKVAEWFRDEGPLHLVAHSMGGLVARTFIARHPQVWERVAGGGGRLIMMGTPNYGSFIIPQLITGAEAKVRQLALLDWRHSLGEVLEIVNSFPGSLQMLPSPNVLPEMRALYDVATYGGVNVPQRHLDGALLHHDTLRDVVDDERMVYVAGYGRLTPANLRDARRAGSLLEYDVTRLGDGRVTHELGIPRLPGGGQISRVYYTPAGHGDLARDERVIGAILELLERGETGLLEKEVPGWLLDETRSGADGRATESAAAYISEQEELVKGMAAVIERLSDQRGALTSDLDSEADRLVSAGDRVVRELLLGDAPAQPSAADAGGARPTARAGEAAEHVESEAPIVVEIKLKWARIQDVGESVQGYAGQEDEEGATPIDAISVGHYLGYGKPLMAEEALDDAISRKLHGFEPAPVVDDPEAGSQLADTERLLTLYSYRGIIRGELGQPFLLNDPRAQGRIIAIAGMGEAGRFWTPELTVLAREMCWALGRAGKKHLATVLIGAGQGNMQVDECVAAWLRGIKYALTGSERDDCWRLKRVTFVESDPGKLRVIEDSILQFIRDEQRAGEPRLPSPSPEFRIEYRPLDFGVIKNHLGRTIEQEIDERLRKRARREKEAAMKGAAPAASKDDVPIRITLSLDGNRYRFGAITRTASVPERETTVDPKLVMEVNGELPAARDIGVQSDWGRHLESLLMPKDLRPAFSTDGPVVMMLDATTARIHWEMVPQPESFSASPEADDGDANSEARALDSFLSIGRGFTRQLRTTFAPPPEPPPPPRRLLRVLIVADTWEENRLRGAEAEGRELVELFERFNAAYRAYDPDSKIRVEVKALIGPAEAARRTVHHHLTLKHYDILHFAGHCRFVPNDASASGWLFTGGDVLSANELNRIDNIPKFVFSNACESGVTPERAERRHHDLAPSFAEAFFARGVGNFVCTAWPVNDSAARLFARTLYSALLGLRPEGDSPRGYGRAERPAKMYQAMREARRTVAARKPNGVQTWGAYQHYGNPYLQFFDKEVLDRARARAEEADRKAVAEGGGTAGAGRAPRPAGGEL